jgi:hypothetical protein
MSSLMKNKVKESFGTININLTGPPNWMNSDLNKTEAFEDKYGNL